MVVLPRCLCNDMTSLIGDAGRSRSSTFSSSSNFSWCRSPAELPEFRYASGSQSRGLVVSSGYSLKGIAENLKVNCDDIVESIRKDGVKQVNDAITIACIRNICEVINPLREVE